MSDLDAWIMRQVWKEARARGAFKRTILPLSPETVKRAARIPLVRVDVGARKVYPARHHESVVHSTPVKCAVCGGVWTVNKRESHKGWCTRPFTRKVKGRRETLEWGSQPDQVLVRRSYSPKPVVMRGARRRRSWRKPPKV